MWNKSAICLVFVAYLYQVISYKNEEKFNETKETNRSALNPYFMNTQRIINEGGNFIAFLRGNSKRRVKRQGGTGKFTEAAKMTNLKVMRLYLTLFKNLWASSYVGGAHPMHPDVPKPIVYLFKHRILEFFFPPVGDDAIKT